MLRPGLVSISYRTLSVREIIDLCVLAQVEGVEWGGDVHVPAGEIEVAREVGTLMRESGLEVVAYGSYYRCDPHTPFEPFLETALALGAPSIRVWAGSKGSAEVTGDETNAVLANLYDACEMAAAENIGVVTEYHGNTLTDTRESCREMLDSVGHSNLKTLWQPLRRGPGLNAKITENLEDLKDVAPDLGNVHVYEWRDIEKGKMKRFSLQKSVQWPQYIDELKKIGGDRWMLLEYVIEDEPSRLAMEMAALRAMIEGEPVAY